MRIVLISMFWVDLLYCVNEDMSRYEANVDLNLN